MPRWVRPKRNSKQWRMIGILTTHSRGQRGPTVINDKPFGERFFRAGAGPDPVRH